MARPSGGGGSSGSLRFGGRGHAGPCRDVWDRDDPTPERLLKNLPVRIDEDPRDGSEQEEGTDEVDGGIPAVVLLQADHDERADHAADLAAGVHRRAHHAGVAAADVDDGAPGRAEGEHAGRHGGGDAPGRELGLRGGRGQQHGGAGDEVGGGADAHAPEAQPKAPCSGIGGQSAEQVGHGAQQQGQAGEKAQAHGAEAVLLLEISRQPGDAEVEAKAVGEIHEAQRQGVAVPQQLLPVGPACVMPAAWIPTCGDLFQLRRIHRRMLLGIIPEPTVPGDGPHDAGDAKKQKGPAPPAQARDCECDHGGEPAHDVRGGKEDALDRAAFGAWNPA